MNPESEAGGDEYRANGGSTGINLQPSSHRPSSVALWRAARPLQSRWTAPCRPAPRRSAPYRPAPYRSAPRRPAPYRPPSRRSPAWRPLCGAACRWSARRVADGTGEVTEVTQRSTWVTGQRKSRSSEWKSRDEPIVT